MPWNPEILAEGERFVEQILSGEIQESIPPNHTIVKAPPSSACESFCALSKSDLLGNLIKRLDGK